MSGRWPVISIRTRVVATVFLVAAIAGGGMLAWVFHIERPASIAQAREFARSVAHVTMAGHTAMMSAGETAQRELFLHQIRSAYSVQSLRVLRAPAVVAQFGPGTAAERVSDAMESSVLASGRTAEEIRQREGDDYLKVVMPVTASRNHMGKDCLTCHRVADGALLGAVSLEAKLERHNALVHQVVSGLVAVGALVLLLIAALSWLAISRSLTWPMASLTARLEEIARGDAELAHRLPAGVPDEVGSAVGAFNRVLEKAADMLRSERIASDVFEHALEGIVVTDANTNIIKVNPAFTRTTGYDAREAVGQTPRLLNSGRQNAAFYEEMWDALAASGEWQGEIWNRRKNGEVYPEWLNITTVRAASGEVGYYVGVFSDITERKRSEATIVYQAYHDALTGLPNRALFHDRVEQALAIARRRGKQPVAVMFLDLDRFKFINDTLGHKTGDQLLKEVARRLRAAVRDGDTVARLGGDEFTILLPEVADTAGAEMVARKILDAMRAPCDIGGHEILVTCSVGVSVYPQGGRDADTLMKNADTAMYSAKSGGRAGYRLYDAELVGRTERQFVLETGLRTALHSGRLRLVYQPQYDLRGGDMIGVEALLRWDHPRLGPIAPRDVIDLAERTGDDLAIGRYVMRTACRHVAAWRGEREITVSVNLFKRHFQGDGLEKDVRDVLEESGLPPHRLELQVSQRIAMLNVERAAATFTRLSRLGVRVAVSEFGSEFHDAARALPNFPVDAIKLDNGLVRGLDGDGRKAHLLASVVGVARAPNLVVIAVGVENGEQLEQVRALEFDGAQGHYFSKPLSAEEMEALFHAGRRAPSAPIA